MLYIVKSKLAVIWKSAQVELHGAYSTQRVQDLTTYSNEMGFVRVFLVQLVTPLPCLAITALVDLLPMQPVHESAEANKLFLYAHSFRFGSLTPPHTISSSTSCPSYRFLT